MKRPHPGRLILTLAIGLAVTVAGRPGLGQTPAPANPEKTTTKALRVHGEVAKPLDLTPADLAGLKRQAVTAKAHDGRESKL